MSKRLVMCSLTMAALFAAVLMLPATGVSIPARSRITSAPGEPHTVNDLAWMAGNWEGTTGSEHLEEHWTRPEGHTMLGMSRTVRDGRTSAFEFLRLEDRPDGVYYVAQPGGHPPKDFLLTNLEGSEATFSNPGNGDHLSRIIYRKNPDGSLFARIEGANDGKAFSEDYSFHMQR